MENSICVLTIQTRQKKKVEFVESIKADIEWLGADWEDRLFLHLIILNRCMRQL